ncbi:hypothetical protein BK784_16875 [Bacillus thuringiensis serovar medellin]|uniref:Uncharacterized protein n=1 Tax=Bacillus thuringiensis subsp. medellin TaxID=79672 RepID=A0A9X6N5F3_BACTV|nr:hypothetical protein [Bacillus thuringiensis]OUB98421.1 hypothetical protein BK784_16875 [Bacillus thuringiensis serovar medellin]
MTVSGIINVNIPENSFFDYKNNNINSYNNNLDALSLFFKMKNITELEKGFINSIEGEELVIDDDKYYGIYKVDPKLLNYTPIQSHNIVKPSPNEKNIFINAMKHLKNNFPDGYKLVQEFVKIIIWVSLKEEYKGRDSQITSSSFPSMPFGIFLSNKAEFHIPPNNIAENISFRYLAENIFHEAIHQAVNMNILLNDILVNDYNSKNSPKIEIPWRHSQAKRNQYWEIDRTYHATVVYSQLIKYRFTQLNDNSISKKEKEFFKEACYNGVEAALYLSDCLLKQKEFFTELGVNLIQELYDDIRQQELQLV